MRLHSAFNSLCPLLAAAKPFGEDGSSVICLPSEVEGKKREAPHSVTLNRSAVGTVADPTAVTAIGQM